MTSEDLEKLARAYYRDEFARHAKQLGFNWTEEPTKERAGTKDLEKLARAYYGEDYAKYAKEMGLDPDEEDEDTLEEELEEPLEPETKPEPKPKPKPKPKQEKPPGDVKPAQVIQVLEKLAHLIQSRPNRAVITHSDGTTSTIKLDCVES